MAILNGSGAETQTKKKSNADVVRTNDRVGGQAVGTNY